MNAAVFTSEDVLVRILPTPNPNAWKFVVNFPVLTEGKLSYANGGEAEESLLARSLFEISGVTQVHFFKNVITVTHEFDVDIDDIQSPILAVIKSRLPVHNPDIGKPKTKTRDLSQLSEEAKAVNEILDRTVRPALQGDGGDIEVLEVSAENVYVRYEGACGTCPSSLTATLSAIEGILKTEYREDARVHPI